MSKITMTTVDNDKRSDQDKLADYQDMASQPGHVYLSTYLPPIFGNVPDVEFLARAIDRGELIACDRCHFLRLPLPPFSADRHDKASGPALPECDVCAHLTGVLKFPFHYDDMGKVITNAVEALAEARLARARVFYDLWMGALDSADALVYGTMAASLDSLRLSAPPAPDDEAAAEAA